AIDGVSAALVSGSEAAALRGASGYLPTDRTSARIFAEVAETTLVDVPAGHIAAEPIVVGFKGSDTDQAQAGHVVLRFGANSRADVVLFHEGSATVAHVVETV